MDKIQIIFTHENGQDVANIPIDIISLKNKTTAVSCLKTLFYGKYAFLHNEWKEVAFNTATNNGNIHIPEDLMTVPNLIKISMCIIGNATGILPNIPKWYNECNGKIYFNS